MAEKPTSTTHILPDIPGVRAGLTAAAPRDNAESALRYKVEFIQAIHPHSGRVTHLRDPKVTQDVGELAHLKLLTEQFRNKAETLLYGWSSNAREMIEKLGTDHPGIEPYAKAAEKYFGYAAAAEARMANLLQGIGAKGEAATMSQDMIANQRARDWLTTGKDISVVENITHNAPAATRGRGNGNALV